MSSRIRVEGGGPGDEQPAVPRETPLEPGGEPQDAPATPEPAPPPVEEPAGEPPAAADEDAAPNPFEDPRVKQRLDRLTRESYEAKRQAAELQRQWAELQEQARQAQQPPGTVDPRAQAREDIRQEQLVAQFNRACDDLFAKGSQEYGEDQMRDAVSALNAVGWGPGRPDALAAVTQLPESHKVYRELASNLDNAARILALPPMAMAMELAQMAAGGRPGNDNGVVAEQAANDDAPPIRASRPIGGTTRAAERPLDKVSMAEFIRRRDRDEKRSRIMR